MDIVSWGWLLLIAGVTAGLSCLAMLKRRKKPVSELLATQGVVMKSESWEAVTNYGNIPSARITFNYEIHGRPYTCKQNWANGPEPPRAGTPVTVYYDPDRPHKASVLPSEESSGSYALMLLFVILAVNLTGIGLFMIFTNLGHR